MNWFNTIRWMFAIAFVFLSVAMTVVCFYQHSVSTGIISLLNTCAFVVTLVVFRRWSR